MKILAFTLSVLLLSACSGTTISPLEQRAVMGGTVGTVMGAGTGALVGSLIKNGSVAKSALLGAGIGLPAGVLAAVAYNEYQETRDLRENRGRIAANQYYLEDMQREIAELRSRLRDETTDLPIDRQLPAYEYLGPSLGNPYR